MRETLISITKQKTDLVPFLRAQCKEKYGTDSVLLNCDVYIKGWRIDSKFWEITTVEADTEIEIVPNIQLTAGTAIVAAITSTAAASFTVGMTVAAYAIAAVLYVGASLIINWAMTSLFSPEVPKSHNASGETKTLPVVSGATNPYRPNEPLMQVIGTYRVSPDLALPYYSVISNGVQDIRHLFCVSAGVVDVWDIRKDTTPISALAGVEYKIYNGWRGEPLQWFDTAITATQENFSTRDYAIFKATSPLNTKAVGLIINFNQGLKKTPVKYENAGIPSGFSCSFEVKATSSTGETITKNYTASNSNGNLSAYRYAISLDFPNVGEWSIEVKSYQGGYPANNRIDSGTWQRTIENNIIELQWHKNEKALHYSGQAMTLIELKATASDKLTGGLNTINCMARLKGKKADGTLVDSSNIALQIRRLLTDPDIIKNTDLVHIDDDSFAAFEAHCDKYGFTANSIENQGRRLRAVFTDMLRVAQGFIDDSSGIYELFYDNPSQPYIDTVTDRSSWGVVKTDARQIKLVDGLKIQFNNKDKDYQQDERLVAENGVNPINTQTIQMPFIDNADLAYKYGMLVLAMQRLRKSIFHFNCDWRCIDYKIGQKIKIQKVNLFYGVGVAGKILKYYRTESGAVEAVELDQFYNVTTGVSYTLALAQKDQRKTWDIKVLQSENTNILYFAVPIEQESTLPKIQSLCILGESTKVGQEVLIRNITRNKDYSAEIEALISDERYYEAITGVIPPFESGLTFDTAWERNKPYTPSILSVNIIRESVTRDEVGRIKANANMSLNYVEKNGVDFYQYKISIKEQGSDQEPTIYTSAEKENFLLTGILQNVTYEIGVIAVSSVGTDSEQATLNYYSHELMEDLPTVTGFTTVYNNSRLDFIFNSITDWRPFVYEIRKGKTWLNSQLVTTMTTPTATPIISAGEYLVKAVAGYAQSTEACGIEVFYATGEDLPENVIATINEQETMWNGQTSDFEYIESTNSIKLDTGSNFRSILNIREVFDIRTSGYTGAEGIYYIDEEKTIYLDSNHSCNISIDLEVEAFIREFDFRKILNIRNSDDIRGIVQGGYEATVEMLVRTNNVWATEWIPFYPSNYIGDGFKFRLKASAGDNTFLFINKFNAFVDVPDKIIDKSNVVVENGVLNYEFVPPFNKKPTVVPTILDSEDDSYYLLEDGLIDKNGFLLRIFDKQGNPTTKNINFIAKGY